MEAAAHRPENVVVAVLIALIVIVLAARAAGAAAAALKQPRAVGEIIAGLLLGPSFLGHFFPGVSLALFSPVSAEPIMVLSQIGLVLLLFQDGSDAEFGHLDSTRNKIAVAATAIASIAAPLAIGFIIGRASTPALAGNTNADAYAMFVAIALAVTAVPVLGRILRQFQLNRVDTGVIALSASAINDVTVWLLLAAISAYASSHLTLGSAILQLVEVIAYVLALRFIVRSTMDALIKRFPIGAGKMPAGLMAIVVALLFASALTTQAIGVFMIFGSFMFGMLFHRHHAFVAAWREQVGQFVLVFFLPIYFTYTGLRANVLGLDTGAHWLWLAIIVACAIPAKIIPVYLANRLAGLGHTQASMIGVLMNCRGLTGLIVLNIGYSLGLVPQAVFTMLVIMSVITTLITGPLLSLLLRRGGQPVGELVEA
ncbi:MAG: cation:proton antiporter [Pseudomonadota bacterium]